MVRNRVILLTAFDHQLTGGGVIDSAVFLLSNFNTNNRQMLQ